MNGTEKEWRLDPLNAQWAKNLVAQQLPRLRRSGYANSEWLLFVSDQPRVAKGLAARAQGAPDIGSAAHFDAAADAALWSATARENDGRFMIHSSDWGPGPRWAAVAEIFVLSAAQQAVACAGPYSPSSPAAVSGISLGKLGRGKDHRVTTQGAFRGSNAGQRSTRGEAGAGSKAVRCCWYRPMA